MNMDVKDLSNTLEWYYLNAKKDKSCDLNTYLQVILESKDSYWNYRAALLCLTEKRIPSSERHKYVIRHAEILFENNQLEYIIRFLTKIYDKPEYYNKPTYKGYVNSKKSINYYKEELAQQTFKSRLAEQQRQKEIQKRKGIDEGKFKKIECSNNTELEKSVYILSLNDPEYNYYAITNLKLTPLQKKKHFKKILESKDAYWNYKCIKKILRSNLFEEKEKVKYIKMHVEVVLNSNDQVSIYKLSKFLKNKNRYNKFIESTEKNKKRSRIKINEQL